MAHLGSYQQVVDAALEKLSRDKIIAGIWSLDHTVWSESPEQVTNRLGWLRIADAMRENVPRLNALAEAVRADGYTHALLLGMGGSSLAPEVFRKTFGVGSGCLDLAVLDSTDPGAVLAHANRLDLSRTLFIVSTKSGGTVETLSFFKFFYNQVVEQLGEETAGSHFIAITDPGSKLVDLARQYRFRDVFLNDPNLGGRYSALSFFGLVPAALVGVDLPILLDHTHAISSTCAADSASENQCAVLGVVMGELANAGRDKLTLIVSPALESFSDWVEQLIAESTGKNGKGILPIVREPLMSPAAYGDDRLFVHLRLDGDATHDDAVAALENAGNPVFRLDVSDKYALGGQFFLWEMATAIAGHLLGIQPFDQPNVESAKMAARKMVAAYSETGQLPAQKAAITDGAVTVYGDTTAAGAGEALNAFLRQAQPGDYVSLQAYLPPTPETDALLDALRVKLAKGTASLSRIATTMGYGPRFLHSTGQLHKGDAGSGLFVQFTSDPVEDADIPDVAGQPQSAMTFGVLKMAQALGDAHALRDAHRRVIRFHLGVDVAGGLKKLIAALS